MSEEILINVTPQETRVAVIQQGVVQEVQIERTSARGWVGNIYMGRVVRVLPGMQSAFVDIGLERDGFLYVSDVIATFEEFDRLETDEDEAAADAQKGGGGRGGRREREKGPEPKIEELLKPGQEIIVQVAKEPLGTKGARLTSHATMQIGRAHV